MTRSPLGEHRVKPRMHIAAVAVATTFLGAACSSAPSSDAQRPTSNPLQAPRPSNPKAQPLNTPSESPGQAPGRTAGAGTALGSTAYPVPAGAIVVAPGGTDTNPGTAAAPLRTVGRAVAVAAPGSTIVLRSGTYHESVTIPAGRRVTIQNWPGEVVWLDGSETVGGWVADGARWRRDGWTVRFDHSPTYTRGAPDNTQDAWVFISPDAPMAAHPDQVWVDGQAQSQTGSVDLVGTGAFYKDDPGNTLWLGTDPTGRDVRAATLVKAMSIRAAGTTVRGIGLRRFSPSVPDMGAITVEAPDVTLEDLVVTDMATTGISVVSTGATLRNLDVSRSGMLGIHANYADGVRLLNVASHHNNTERFNTAPVSGGFKVTKTRGVTVTNSVFSDNRGPGMWTDQSVYDITVTGSDLSANVGHGISLEQSAKVVFADNVVAGNGGSGAKVNDTSDVTLVNNTFVGNNRPVNIVQDARRAADANAQGHDPRQPFPDPTMTWINGPVLLQGNIISAPTAGNCLLCVEDYSKQFTAEQFGVSASGNLYHRTTAGSPAWLVVWSRGASNPAVFDSLAAFQAGTGQEAAGRTVTGAPPSDLAGKATQVAAALDAGAPPLPATVATLIGQATGTRHFGAFR